MHLDLYQYFQLLSLAAAVICYSGLRAYSLQAFIPLLVVVNAAELAGAWVYASTNGGNNDFIYNLYLLISTPLHLYLFGKMLRLNPNEKKTFFTVCFLCMVLVLMNYFFYQGRLRFNYISAIIIETVNIIFSCFVLLRMAQEQSRKPGLLREPYFWICAASLLFALMALVILGLQSYIRNENITVWGVSLYSLILSIVNIILYSVYSFAFVLCKTQKTR